MLVVGSDYVRWPKGPKAGSLQNKDSTWYQACSRVSIIRVNLPQKRKQKFSSPLPNAILQVCMIRRIPTADILQ